MSPFLRYAAKKPPLLLRPLARRYIQRGVVLNKFLIIFATLILFGCGSGGNDDAKKISLSELEGTIWVSPPCQSALGRAGKHEIEFTSEKLIYEYTFYTDGCDGQTEDPVKYVAARPYSAGDYVITESGLAAIAITISTEIAVLPNVYTDYLYDVLDYIYYSDGSLYFSDKTESNCLKDLITNLNDVAINVGCAEWSPILDFDRPYTKKI